MVNVSQMVNDIMKLLKCLTIICKKKLM